MTINALDEFLRPWSLTGFFFEVWEKRYTVFRGCDFRIPFSQDSFHQLLATAGLHPPRVQCFEAGREVPAESFTHLSASGREVDPLAIRGLDGVTVRISNVDAVHPELRPFRKRLSELFGCEIHVNAYLTQGRSVGLPAHYDPHHIFAIQLFGNKAWELGQVIINNPTHEFLPRPTGTARLTETESLKPGDMIYLPPGCWHSASTEIGSLHLTVGVHPPKWESLLHDVLSRTARKHPIYRASLPMEVRSSGCRYSADQGDAERLLGFLAQEAGDLTQVDATSRGRSDETSNHRGALRAPLGNPCLQSLFADIWALSEAPCALYLRGSYAIPHGSFAPWDLDVYFVVQGPGSGELDVHRVCEELDARYPDLPRLDLTIVSRDRFLFGDRSLLHRFLLVREGVHIRGERLADIVALPPLDEDTAGKIRVLMSQFIERILISFDWGSRNLDRMSTLDFELYTRTVAKALIRSGVFLGVREGEFSRDLDRCCQRIESAFPDSKRELGIMMARVRGRNAPLAEFVEAATSLYRAVYSSGA